MAETSVNAKLVTGPRELAYQGEYERILIRMGYQDEMTNHVQQDYKIGELARCVMS